MQAAARGGHLGVVETLLAANAGVNAAGGARGATALQGAAKGGHLKVVETLLAANTDVNAAPGDSGETALQAAAKGGHLKIVEKLEKALATRNGAQHSRKRRTTKIEEWPNERYGRKRRFPPPQSHGL